MPEDGLQQREHGRRSSRRKQHDSSAHRRRRGGSLHETSRAGAQHLDINVQGRVVQGQKSLKWWVGTCPPGHTHFSWKGYSAPHVHSEPHRASWVEFTSPGPLAAGHTSYSWLGARPTSVVCRPEDSLLALPSEGSVTTCPLGYGRCGAPDRAKVFDESAPFGTPHQQRQPTARAEDKGWEMNDTHRRGKVPRQRAASNGGGASGWGMGRGRRQQRRGREVEASYSYGGQDVRRRDSRSHPKKHDRGLRRSHCDLRSQWEQRYYDGAMFLDDRSRKRMHAPDEHHPRDGNMHNARERPHFSQDSRVSAGSFDGRAHLGPLIEKAADTAGDQRRGASTGRMEEFPALGGGTVTGELGGDAVVRHAQVSYASRLRQGLHQPTLEVHTPPQKAAQHEPSREESLPLGSVPSGLVRLRAPPRISQSSPDRPLNEGGQVSDRDGAGGWTHPMAALHDGSHGEGLPAPTAPHTDSAKPSVQPAGAHLLEMAQASKRLAARYAAKVREQWSHRSLVAERERLERRLMALEDERSKRVRRLESGHDDDEEAVDGELVVHEQHLVSADAPKSSHQQHVATGAPSDTTASSGWYAFLRPGVSVHTSLVVGERQDAGVGRKGTDAARARHEDYTKLAKIIVDPSAGWKDLWRELDAGVDWDAREKGSRQSALHLASAVNRVEMLEALLQRAPPSAVEAADRRRMTPLLHAAGAEGSEGLKLLLKSGAKVEARDRQGETALHKAARSGREKNVSLLLSRLRVSTRNKRRETPLHLAAEGGHEGVVSQLLSHGADVWAASSDGETPIALAASHGHLSTLILLLGKAGQGLGESGPADGERRRNPLHEAAACGQTKTLLYLIGQGYSPRTVIEVNGRAETSLLRAVERGHLSTAQLLVEHGASRWPGRHDETLIVAAASCRVECLRWLLEDGGSVTEENKSAALDAAVRAGALECVAALVEAGAKVEDRVLSLWMRGRGAAPQKASDDFLSDIAKLLPGNNTDADVVLVVEEGRARIRAHRCVLAARSEKFLAMFTRGFREADQEELWLPRWSEHVFHDFLRWLYLGQGPKLGDAPSDVSELLILADEFIVPSLRLRCEHVLGRQLRADQLEAALDLASGLRLDVLRKYCEVMITRSGDERLKRRYSFLVLDHVQATHIEDELERSGGYYEGSAKPWADHARQWLSVPTRAKVAAMTWFQLDEVLSGGVGADGVVDDMVREVRTGWEDGRAEWHGVVPPQEALRDDLQRMLYEGLLTDCGITAEESRLPIPTHRCILSARSERLAAHFRFTDNAHLRSSSATPHTLRDTHIIIPLLAITPRALPAFLSYLYGGRLDARFGEVLPTDVLLELVAAADELLLPPLSAMCDVELARRVNVTNAVGLFMAAESVNGCPELRVRAAKTVVQEFRRIEKAEGRAWREEGVHPQDVLKAALDSLS